MSVTFLHAWQLPSTPQLLEGCRLVQRCFVVLQCESICFQCFCDPSSEGRFGERTCILVKEATSYASCPFRCGWRLLGMDYTWLQLRLPNVCESVVDVIFWRTLSNVGCVAIEAIVLVFLLKIVVAPPHSKTNQEGSAITVLTQRFISSGYLRETQFRSRNDTPPLELLAIPCLKVATAVNLGTCYVDFVDDLAEDSFLTSSVKKRERGLCRYDLGSGRQPEFKRENVLQFAALQYNQGIVYFVALGAGLSRGPDLWGRYSSFPRYLAESFGLLFDGDRELLD